MIRLLKQYWYIVLLIFVPPLLLNFFLSLHSPIDIIGDSELWLSFWGSYLASVVTLLVLLATLKQQIVLFKKGLIERKIQNLSTNIKENFDFVKYTDVHYNIELIKKQEYDKAKMFFFYESQKCSTKLCTLDLDFNQQDTIKYKNIFRKQCGAYADLINHAIRVIILSSVDTLEKKVSEFIRVETNEKGKKLFTQEEYDKIIKSKSEDEFRSALIETLYRCFQLFSETYGRTQPILIRISENLINDNLGSLSKFN